MVSGALGWSEVGRTNEAAEKDRHRSENGKGNVHSMSGRLARHPIDQAKGAGISKRRPRVVCLEYSSLGR